jgi:uncharacterized membrane protein YkoI
MNRIAITLLAAAAVLTGCDHQNVEKASNDFNSLPPQVQKTARAEAPSAEVASVSKLSTNGMDAYKIEFREKGRNPSIIVGANGTLLSTEVGKQAGMIDRLLTPTGSAGTPFSALPVAVQKTIQAQAPNAQVANISRHEENGRTIYEIEFKDQGKNPTIKIAEDGTLVQNLQK